MSQVEMDLDDGHRPGKSDVMPRCVRTSQSPDGDFFSTFQGVLGEEWRDRAYVYAIEHCRPWGTYVTMESALNAELSPEELFSKDPIQAIALKATRALILEKGSDFSNHWLSQVHGTAVWCLVSGEEDSVQYHVDYAELYRYETGIIHTPALAGTIHLSPIAEGGMEGGEFMCNSEGVEHYRRFGYKGNLAPQELLADLSRNENWKTVAYRADQGILHTGCWPHLSRKVVRLPLGVKRVILGLNCFCGDAVGESCVRAPEHSDAFNRTVKLYQALAQVAPSFSESDTDKTAQRQQREGISLASIMRNKPLVKLLLLAAKKTKALN